MIDLSQDSCCNEQANDCACIIELKESIAKNKASVATYLANEPILLKLQLDLKNKLDAKSVRLSSLQNLKVLIDTFNMGKI